MRSSASKRSDRGEEGLRLSREEGDSGWESGEQGFPWCLAKREVLDDGGRDEASGVEDGVPRKRQALEADPSKNPKPSRARVYTRLYTHTHIMCVMCALRAHHAGVRALCERRSLLDK